MAEYIDREAAKNLLVQDYAYAAANLLDYLVAADVEEVKHGRWIEQNLSGEATWCCSECKTIGSPQWKRCPVCEAKMNGGKENEGA